MDHESGRVVCFMVMAVAVIKTAVTGHQRAFRCGGYKVARNPAASAGGPARGRGARVADGGYG